ncbi:MAG: hypothetical protein ABR517_05025, partial [Thermoanaerobaculia bacterium]
MSERNDHPSTLEADLGSLAVFTSGRARDLPDARGRDEQSRFLYAIHSCTGWRRAGDRPLLPPGRGQKALEYLAAAGFRKVETIKIEGDTLNV